MKLPEPIGEVVDWDSMGSPYVHWNTKPGSITNLYSEAQVKELLAQADSMLIAHMNGADQMRKRYEPVLKQALEALWTTAPPKCGDAIKAIQEVLA